MQPADPRDSADSGVRHEVTLTDRSSIAMDGIKGVEEFDDEEIRLNTQLGSMLLRGESLHIRHLDLESGKLRIEGRVDSLQYVEGRTGSVTGRGLIQRILK